MTEEILEKKEPEGGTDGGGADTPEKTFTQADLDRIVGERLARQKKELPNDDELKGYREWKKTQQTEAEKAAETQKKLEALTIEAEALRHENAARKAGVNEKFIGYVTFEVGKMDGDFDKNLEKYLTDNADMKAPATVDVKGGKHEAGGKNDEDGVLAAFLKKNPDLKSEFE